MLFAIDTYATTLKYVCITTYRGISALCIQIGNLDAKQKQLVVAKKRRSQAKLSQGYLVALEIAGKNKDRYQSADKLIDKTKN